MQEYESVNQPLKILIIGLGVIGTTYGYLFQKAGHHVEHFIRQNSPKRSISKIGIDLLDGRQHKKGVQKSDSYHVQFPKHSDYDLIFVSVPSGGIAEVVAMLDYERISGTMLLCCGLWDTKDELGRLMQKRPYILGYPVAGGNMTDGVLKCCVFDHFMLEREARCDIPNRQDILRLFADCKIKTEEPYDMLEWMWIHMAINAGVVSVAGRYGDIHDTTKSAEYLMNSSRILSKAITAIRETTSIVASRGVKLKKYRNELFAYHLPTFISAPLMKRLFSHNELTRRIMTLHGNTADLIYVCRSIYECGKKNNIPAPLFYNCYEAVMRQVNESAK